ncbi:TetR/AcrR family transcriptional regulator [Draconibacterium sp. IB214405]|uniref:TetR/AcrR family transcriptional regulator n=1 Tax=Draconibacterium sp. IB214405 TaxID=3097352 RepID=UPI002A0DDE49|nr:TetR/AcrR family transcriptional regulator [Draconibacterium sp. IB214405]MDX8338878.1 TetR/AcrR family transcriptional regulator [Draconibacterium sp. IB214405]
MPKETFIKLKEEKQKQIREAFLREFAIKTYDEASISMVVKQLGIAKGSVYQYFEDKLDLFMYLVNESVAVKSKYTAVLKRENYPDFWAYFSDLYEYGFQFDQENPLNSHFLHNLTQNLNSPSIKHFYNELLSQVITGFEKLAEYEVENGLFRSDVPVKTLGFFLYKLGSSIQEQLEISGIINPKESIQKGLPVYFGKKDELMQVVADYIKLAKPAFNKN